MDVQIVDPTQNLDVYNVSGDRDVRLLSMVRKFHAYFYSGAGSKSGVPQDFPWDFEMLYEWTKRNKDAATQLASVYVQEVIFKSDRKDMSKYVSSHVQVLNKWGIKLHEDILTSIKTKNKEVWLPASKNESKYTRAKRALYQAVGDNIIPNIIKSLGELDLQWFRDLLASESTETQAGKRFKKFRNNKPKRGKTPADLKLLMLVQRSIVSLGATWGIRGINLISLNLNKCTFDDRDNTLTYEFRDKSKPLAFICLKLHANAEVCPPPSLS